MGESSLPSHLLPGDAAPSKPHISHSDRRALQRLVDRSVPLDELPTLIETIVSNVKAPDIVKTLQGNGAQTFADITNEACHHSISSQRNWPIDLLPNPLFVQMLNSLEITSQVRRKCVKSLYKMCAGRNLLPISLRFELREDPAGVVVCRGGFADVSKHEHCGREVAVKVLRSRGSDHSQDMINVGHWRTLLPRKCRLTEGDICRGSARRS